MNTLFIALLLLIIGILISKISNKKTDDDDQEDDDNVLYITKVESFQSSKLEDLTDQIQSFFDLYPESEYLDIKYQNTGAYYTALLIYQTSEDES